MTDGLKGICTVRTPDGGIRYFADHDPVMASPGAPFSLTIQPPPQPNQKFSIRLRVCRRCGLAYTDAVSRDFTQGTSLTPEPDPTTS